MCRYLGITRSSYYRWLKHPKSDNEIRNEQIADIIREIHRCIQIWVIGVSVMNWL